MLLAAFDFLTRNDWFLISLFLVVTSYFLYRPRRFPNKNKQDDPRSALAGIRESFDENAREAVRTANRAEVRLYDYEREVEGKMQTRLAVLDQLILESEHKILQLQKVLEESRAQSEASPKESPTRGEIRIPEPHRVDAA